MEWVETTARTVDEAKEQALDQLGVAEDDAEFEVLDEPKPGLFGRVRGEARVRARVRPTQPRRRSIVAIAAATRTRAATPHRRVPRCVHRRLHGLPAKQRRPVTVATERGHIRIEHRSSRTWTHDRSATRPASSWTSWSAAFGFTAATELIEDGDDLEVRVDGENLGLLVGPRGTTLQAVQDLTRVASQRRLGDHDTRLRVDIGGYRERRREALGRFATQMADEVKVSGVARVLEPMSSADRKIIHDVLTEVDGSAPGPRATTHSGVSSSRRRMTDDDSSRLRALTVIRDRGAIGERSLVDAVAHADRFVALIPPGPQFGRRSRIRRRSAGSGDRLAS